MSAGRRRRRSWAPESPAPSPAEAKQTLKASRLPGPRSVVSVGGEEAPSAAPVAHPHVALSSLLVLASHGSGRSEVDGKQAGGSWSRRGRGGDEPLPGEEKAKAGEPLKPLPPPCCPLRAEEAAEKGRSLSVTRERSFALWNELRSCSEAPFRVAS